MPLVRRNPRTDDLEWNTVHAAILGAVAVVAIALLIPNWAGSAVTWVPPGEHAVVFNSLSGNLRERDAGLGAKWPLFDTVQRYETRGQLHSTPAEGASRDLQVVHTEVAVEYKPLPGTIAALHLELGPSYADRAVKPAVQECVKAVTARFTAVQLIEERPLVKQQVVECLKTALLAKQIDAVTVSLTDFDFSEEFNNAIEAKVTAEQRAQEANNTLQRVFYEAQQPVVQARANLEVANLTSQAIVTLAHGNATAIRTLQDQLGGSTAYLTYLRLLQWNGVMPQTLVAGADPNETNVLVGLP